MKVVLKESASVYGRYFERGEAQVSQHEYECLKNAGKLIKRERGDEAGVETVSEQSREKLSTNTLKALKANGISVEQATRMSLNELVDLKGIGEKTAKQILEQ